MRAATAVRAGSARGNGRARAARPQRGAPAHAGGPPLLPRRAVQAGHRPRTRDDAVQGRPDPRARSRSGVVQIAIAAPALIDPDLSEQLALAYGLRRAIVLAVADCPEPELRRYLAQVTAELLTEIVTDDDVLGIGYGRTLNETTASLTRLARCTTVQLAGALLEVHVSENSIELVRRVAAVSAGPAYPLYTPQVLPDPETARTLRGQPQVAAVYRQFEGSPKRSSPWGRGPRHTHCSTRRCPRASASSSWTAGGTAELCATVIDARQRRGARAHRALHRHPGRPAQSHRRRHRGRRRP